MIGQVAMCSLARFFYLKVLKRSLSLLTPLRERPQGPKEQEKIFRVFHPENKRHQTTITEHSTLCCLSWFITQSYLNRFRLASRLSK